MFDLVKGQKDEQRIRAALSAVDRKMGSGTMTIQRIKGGSNEFCVD